MVMWRTLLFVVTVLGVVPAWTTAVEVTNLRSINGPLGAPRNQTKFLPGDVIYLVFDINDLQTDKNGLAQFQIKVEVFDPANKKVFAQEQPPSSLHLLGGKKLPWYVFVLLEQTWAPGKYQVKLTAVDREAKTSRTITHNFELLSPAFGLIQPAAPGVAFVGQDFFVTFLVVGMKRDSKKMPDVSFTLQMYDETNRPVFAKPLVSNIKDLHQEKVFDLTEQAIVPIKYPFYPTREGRFIIEVEGFDQIGKQKSMLRFPLRILETADYTGK